MVTRYTIDQILSRGTSSPPEVSSPTHLSPTTSMHSPLWRPTSLTDDPLKVTQHFNSIRHKDQHRDNMPPPTREDEETHKRDGHVDLHPLARPVALRPPHGLGLPTHESPTLEAFGLRPEVGYGGIDGSAYLVMLRQYMEAQYQLGGPRGLLPLHFQGFDPGVVAAAGSGRTRRRGGQVRFTTQQTRQLETWFMRHKYITPPQRKTIARELSLHEKQVKTWFQNRRAKWRKVQAQGGCEDGMSVSTMDVDVTASSPASSHDDGDDATSEHSLTGEGTPCMNDSTMLYN